ncbi:MAG: 5-(carboxyamino)imidazole ribonucleotide synthase [Bythopirellula sp.]
MTDRTGTNPTGTSRSDPILPGATLGIFGSGQLGRMFAQAAARLGYRVHVYSPAADSPAGQVADLETIADYDDVAALTEFAQSVAVVTLEFENVPTIAVETVGKFVPVRPSAQVLHITQNRLREKRFLVDTEIECSPFAEVNSPEQLHAGMEKVGLPAVLKTSDSGYDGKGHAMVRSADVAVEAWEGVGGHPAVLEAFVDFERELSVIVSRSTAGEMAIQGPIANDHANHILDVSMFPLPELDPVAAGAQQIARQIAAALELVGVACIEFFLTRTGKLLVNEIAPRPHNSGHLTIEASVTSQFERQVRAICGLPLGSTEPVSPAAMVNLLGDLWTDGQPNWQAALADPQVRLHLYGKSQPRPGRKMGHLTVLASTATEAAQRAQAARRLL